MKMRDFYVLFLRKAHSTEHPSRGGMEIFMTMLIQTLRISSREFTLCNAKIPTNSVFMSQQYFTNVVADINRCQLIMKKNDIYNYDWFFETYRNKKYNTMMDNEAIFHFSFQSDNKTDPRISMLLASAFSHTWQTHEFL